MTDYRLTQSQKDQLTEHLKAIGYVAGVNREMVESLPVIEDESPEPEPEPEPAILISVNEVRSLPQDGDAWQRVADTATGTWDDRPITDQVSDRSNHAYAGALYGVVTDDDATIQRSLEALRSMPTDWASSEKALGISRNLASAVIAADILDHRDPEFVDWVAGVLDHNFSGRTIRSTHRDRPNNWGTHAGASRVAAELFLHGGVSREAWDVHRGWCGDYEAWPHFQADYGLSPGDTSWQADPDRPVGVNPPGATIEGRNVDGVVPDDQRRGGWFSVDPWPPAGREYTYNALAPAAVTNMILARQGFDAWSLMDNAVLRAVTWLTDECRFTVTDTKWRGAWIAPHLVNHVFSTTFDVSGHRNRKCADTVDFLDWTHAA